MERGFSSAGANFTPGHHAKPRDLGGDGAAQLHVLFEGVGSAQERIRPCAAFEPKDGPGAPPLEFLRKVAGHGLGTAQHVLDGAMVQHDLAPFGDSGLEHDGPRLLVEAERAANDAGDMFTRAIGSIGREASLDAEGPRGQMALVTMSLSSHPVVSRQTSIAERPSISVT